MNHPYTDNFLYASDSYKYSHHKQYPTDLVKLYSYFEARGFQEPFYNEPEVVFYGLQYLIKKLEGCLFTEADVEKAKVFYDQHFGVKNIFNYEGFMYIAKELGGKLPIEIKAVPEGSTIRPGNVLLTVVNTDPKVAWLTNAVETFLTKVWYPTTIATLSREIKKTIMKYMVETSEESDYSSILFRLHDFGMRGASSDEAAALGGSAHLVNFMGTDTISAIRLAQDVYQKSDKMFGFSVPATEHSVMTIRGKAGEYEQLKRVIDAYPESSIVSIVADSYDIYNFVGNWICGTLLDQIMSRSGKIVIRPDSGDPETVIGRILSIIEKKIPDLIKMNSKGYKELPQQLGLIWGDGIGHKDIDTILSFMKIRGWSASNIVFGMGGGLLQKVNRDSLKFAFKASYAEFADGTSVEVYKDPITDKGKSSKRGMLELNKNGNTYVTKMGLTKNSEASSKDVLQTVFKNGQVVKEYSFSGIIERAI